MAEELDIRKAAGVDETDAQPHHQLPGPDSCPTSGSTLSCQALPERVHNLHVDHWKGILRKWAAEVSVCLVAVVWAISCHTKPVASNVVSLVEVTETPLEDSCSDPLEIASAASPPSVSYKLFFWDQAMAMGRWLNNVDTSSQRDGDLLYMPKVLSKDVSSSFSAHGVQKEGMVKTCQILLNCVPVEMVRPKYLRNKLPPELKHYLELLDGLRNASSDLHLKSGGSVGEVVSQRACLGEPIGFPGVSLAQLWWTKWCASPTPKQFSDAHRFFGVEYQARG